MSNLKQFSTASIEGLLAWVNERPGVKVISVCYNPALGYVCVYGERKPRQAKVQGASANG